MTGVFPFPAVIKKIHISLNYLDYVSFSLTYVPNPSMKVWIQKITVHLTANHQPAVGARDIVREILRGCNAAFYLVSLHGGRVREAYLVILLGLSCSSID
jgi:hypothetical protein